ncbi:MAG: homoserine O-acetyltransferase [Alphaproteobacteria bacterium]|nr:homoserine O-acetyltransferase [Alphaproteobacteria bacterium]
MRKTALRFGFALAVLTFAQPSLGYDGPVEKKTFALPSYTTVGGRTIKDVKIGWESYGKLNEARSNAILITHFFSGNSHAAGKYKPEEKVAGYWDPIIGAGKPIDTDKYFVISSDTLVNLNTKSPTTVTTGPASINPDTGKPYGMSFPVVGIRDFVNVQKALLDSLGIKKLHAVVGASMGALQAMEWAAGYPDMVERVVPVIGDAETNAWLIGWLNVWAAPIMLDPNWNNGDYYGRPEPTRGLAEALKIVSLHAQGTEWANKTFARKWAEEGKNPLDGFANKYLIEATLEKGAAARAAASDANSFLYLVKANQLFIADNGGSLEEIAKKIKARMLLLPGVGDHIFPPANSQRVRDAMKAAGKDVEYAEIDGPNGHLNGVIHIAKQGEAIRAFLAK